MGLGYYDREEKEYIRGQAKYNKEDRCYYAVFRSEVGDIEYNILCGDINVGFIPTKEKNWKVKIKKVVTELFDTDNVHLLNLVQEIIPYNINRLYQVVVEDLQIDMITLVREGEDPIYIIENAILDKILDSFVNPINRKQLGLEGCFKYKDEEYNQIKLEKEV